MRSAKSGSHSVVRFDKFLAHGQAHNGIWGKWPWCSTISGLDNSILKVGHAGITCEHWANPCMAITCMVVFWCMGGGGGGGWLDLNSAQIRHIMLSNQLAVIKWQNSNMILPPVHYVLPKITIIATWCWASYGPVQHRVAIIVTS